MRVKRSPHANTHVSNLRTGWPGSLTTYAPPSSPFKRQTQIIRKRKPSSPIGAIINNITPNRHPTPGGIVETIEEIIRLGEERKSASFAVCNQEGCWSTKHTREGREESKKKFKERFSRGFDKRASQYIAEYEGVDHEIDDDMESIDEATEALMIDVGF